MKKILMQQRNLIALLCTILGFIGTARADSKIFVMDDLQSGVPGTTLSFRGSATNAGTSRIEFTGIDVDTPPGGFWFGFNVTFFENAPAFLDPGETTGDIEIFNVLIFPNTSPGTYRGSILLTDGPTTDFVFGREDFQIIVLDSETPIPEPATMILFGTGLATLGGAMKRRRNKP